VKSTINFFFFAPDCDATAIFVAGDITTQPREGRLAVCMFSYVYDTNPQYQDYESSDTGDKLGHKT
jgi:hypothetical protein